MAMTRRGALSPGREPARQPASPHKPRAIADPASPKPSNAITRGDNDMRLLSMGWEGSGRRRLAVFGVACRPRELRAIARAGDAQLGSRHGERRRLAALGDTGIELFARFDD